MRAQEAPIDFDLPADWSSLSAHLARASVIEGVLESIFELAREHGVTRIRLEGDYIDRDYRDEFVNFYALTYRAIEDRCKRLHFFRQADDDFLYLGYSVLRPVRRKPVGRTVIRPVDTDALSVSCLIEESVVCGESRWSTAGFPFMQQDAQYGVCAHVSIWMIAYYHHRHNHTPRRFLSDISVGAGRVPVAARSRPSSGLSPEQVVAALEALGFSSVLYDIDQLADVSSHIAVEAVACRYLNSRLPVLLTTDEHAVVLIGYGRDVNGEFFFVAADESGSPYRRMYTRENQLDRQWRLFVAPLPGKIYLDGETAEDKARIIFKQLADAKVSSDGAFFHEDEIRRLAENSDDMRLRTYVIRSAEYKTGMRSRGVPPEVAEPQSFVGMSNWIWVVELQDESLAQSGAARCVRGEIVIDATSDTDDPNVLCGYLGSTRYVWHDDIDESHTAYTMEQRQSVLVTTGAAAHDAPIAPATREFELVEQPASGGFGSRVTSRRRRKQR